MYQPMTVYIVILTHASRKHEPMVFKYLKMAKVFEANAKDLGWETTIITSIVNQGTGD